MSAKTSVPTKGERRRRLIFGPVWSSHVPVVAQKCAWSLGSTRTTSLPSKVRIRRSCCGFFAAPHKLPSAMHPGGSVISFYDNMDATDVFAAFHMRSDRAFKWLETLPRRKVEKTDPSDLSPLIRDFRQLQSDLVKEGMFKPLWSVQLYRIFEVLGLQIFGLWVVLNYSWVLGGLIYGLVVGRNGLLMHDMGHRGDLAFSCFFFSYFLLIQPFSATCVSTSLFTHSSLRWALPAVRHFGTISTISITLQLRS